jgi:hypothetical protein
VHALVERKAEELDRTLRDLAAMRRQLTALLRAAARGSRRSVVCPHIEGAGSGREPAARRRRT